MSHDKHLLLVVEDNPSDLELMIRALTRSGFKGELVVAKDGAEALSYLSASVTSPLKGKIPRVIFLDLKLPKVTGLEVVRHIRSDARIRSCPVVILTSSHEERDIEEAYHLGVNSYIVKPVDFDAFTSTIRVMSEYWLSINQCPS